MNTEELYAVAGGIDDSFIDETVKPLRRRGYLRFAAAAAALLLAAGAALGIASAAKNKGAKALDYAWENLPAGYEFMADTAVPRNAALPKTQTADFEARAEYSQSYNIISAYESSEAVCLGTVKNCLGETDTGTYYEVKTQRLYKGDLPETFVLFSLGNSEATVKGAPLFTYGDQLLLFLTPWGHDGYEGSYDSTGADVTLLFAAASKDGGVYLIDRGGLLSYTTKQERPDIKLNNHGSDRELTDELIDYIETFDKATSAQLRTYRDVSLDQPELVPMKLHVYKLEDLESLFAQANDP